MHRPVNRRILRAGLSSAALLVVALGVSAAGPAEMADRLKSMIPTVGFSVSGKPGPFLKQVAKRKLEPPSTKDVADLGFAGDSRGEFQSARLKMPETEKRLEALVARSDASWPYVHPGKIKIHLLADGKYGPNALPDGSIAVPVGFLVRAESDDEVAFVISHEYAHLALAHFGRADRMRTQRRLIRTVAEVYTAGAELSEVRVQQAGQTATFSVADRRKVEAARNRAATAKDQLDWILNNLVEPAWNRRQEDEADALGFDLARGQGYAAADGAGGAFTRITADDDNKAKLVNQLQTQLTDSVNEATAKTSNANGTVDMSAFLNVFSKSLQSGLRDRALRTIESYLSAKHRPRPRVRRAFQNMARRPIPAPRPWWT